MKKLFVKFVAGLLAVGIVALAACSDASTASHNVSEAADNFEVHRRVVFMNGITNDYMLEIIGRCSIEDQIGQLEVICKDDTGTYKKHFLGLSDNVTYFVEQLGAVDVSAYHYRVTFKPQAIIPDIDFRGDAGDGPRVQP